MFEKHSYFYFQSRRAGVRIRYHNYIKFISYHGNNRQTIKFITFLAQIHVNEALLWVIAMCYLSTDLVTTKELIRLKQKLLKNSEPRGNSVELS